MTLGKNYIKPKFSCFCRYFVIKGENFKTPFRKKVRTKPLLFIVFGYLALGDQQIRNFGALPWYPTTSLSLSGTNEPCWTPPRNLVNLENPLMNPVTPWNLRLPLGPDPTLVTSGP